MKVLEERDGPRPGNCTGGGGQLWERHRRKCADLGLRIELNWPWACWALRRPEFDPSHSIKTDMVTSVIPEFGKYKHGDQTFKIIPGTKWIWDYHGLYDTPSQEGKQGGGGEEKEWRTAALDWDGLSSRHRLCSASQEPEGAHPSLASERVWKGCTGTAFGLSTISIPILCPISCHSHGICPHFPQVTWSKIQIKA